MVAASAVIIMYMGLSKYALVKFSSSWKCCAMMEVSSLKAILFLVELVGICFFLLIGFKTVDFPCTDPMSSSKMGNSRGQIVSISFHNEAVVVIMCIRIWSHVTVSIPRLGSVSKLVSCKRFNSVSVPAGSWMFVFAL